MADEYVSQVLLEINGMSIDDFSSVEEGEIERAKPVHLMNKTGKVKVTKRYSVSVDYVVPADKPEFDFDQVDDGTLTIDYQNGKRITYTGVSTLKIGKTTYDGDKEAKKTIDFMANRRSEE